MAVRNSELTLVNSEINRKLVGKKESSRTMLMSSWACGLGSHLCQLNQHNGF